MHDFLKSRFKSKFDMVISNPPYVSDDDMAGLQAEVRDYDPGSALTDNADGLSFYRRFSEQFDDLLRPGGILILEFGTDKQKIDIEKIFSEAKLNTPNMAEVIEQLSDYPARAINETFYALVNLGRLVKIQEEIFVHKDAIEQIENLLIGYLEKHDIITVAEFRELAQTSRKYAVPFLEFCDGVGLTVRNGNHRRLRKNR